METLFGESEKADTQTNPRPFFKWAGGKGQLLNEIREMYPCGLGDSITKYAEPFVGGGAVLFDILSRYSLQSVYISDINAELVNTYKVIRDNADNLIGELEEMQASYLPADAECRKKYYYEKRDLFNDLKISGDKTANIRKAALMIFLNRTCFNGLFRVNRKGLFNVPMGAYKNPTICDANNLKIVSQHLQNIEILCLDYRKSISFIDANTFVYFDPPYKPLTKSASFTAYHENLFDDKAQIELAEFANQMSNAGAKIIISNSDPKDTNIANNFFNKLYAEHNIRRVEATRRINCNAGGRGKISELLISNF